MTWTYHLSLSYDDEFEMQVIYSILQKFQALTTELTSTNTSIWTEMQRLQIVLDGHKVVYSVLLFIFMPPLKKEGYIA